jgi:hypothetical protein
MFQLKIKRGEFEDLVKKMSLPTRNRDFSTGKISFFFTKIAPLFSIDPVTNKGRMEWIGKTNMATPWVRVKKLDISGITEPIRIPLDSRSVLDALESFPSKEIITFIHDTDRQEDISHIPLEKEK